MTDHVTHDPAVQHAEANAQIQLLGEIHSEFLAMRTATAGIVGTKDWSGDAANAAHQAVEEFIAKSTPILDDMTERAQTIVRLADHSTEGDHAAQSAFQNVALPTFTR